MSKIIRWLKKEIQELFPVILYFLISFNLVHFAQTLIRTEGYVRFTSYTGATIAALVAGKIILVTESLPFINAFPRKPLIWNTIWRFMIYSIIVVLVQFLDAFIREWIRTGEFAFARNLVTNYACHPPFWGVQIYELSFFLIYIVFSEFIKAIGGERTRKIFFG